MRLLSVVTFTIFAGAVAWACSCADRRPGPCNMSQSAKAVFVGTVVDIENPPTDKRGDGGGTSRYHFRVEENFTGADAGEVDIYSGRGGADCSYHFISGKQYLVFGYKNDDDGRLFASICSETRPVEAAETLLPQLRAWRNHEPVASVFGKLLQTQQPYDGTYDDSLDQPLANTRLELRGAKTLRMTTDENGRYAFYDVPAGLYRWWAELPQGLELAQTILLEPLPPLKLPAQACFESDVEVLSTARITGRLLAADGTPIEDSVELFRAEQYDESSRGWWEFAEKGRFTFFHVSPGDYVLVFNRENKINPDAPYPRTFYPDAVDFVRAGHIHVSKGQQVTADIHLSGGRAVRTVTVQLKWDNDPSDDVIIEVKPSEGEAPFTEKVSSTIYKVKLLRDAKYRVSAQSWCPRQCDDNGCAPPITRRSNDIAVNGWDDYTQKVELVFSGPGCAELTRTQSK